MLGQVVFADIKGDTSEDIVGNPGQCGICIYIYISTWFAGNYKYPIAGGHTYHCIEIIFQTFFVSVVEGKKWSGPTYVAENINPRNDS